MAAAAEAATEESSSDDEDSSDEPGAGFKWREDVLLRVMAANGIDESHRDDFVRHAVKFDDDDNQYLKKAEIEAAAEAWGGSDEATEEEATEEAAAEEEATEEAAAEEEATEEAAAEEEATEEADTKTCPICNAENPSSAITCVSCGFAY
jgi:ribosomal protein L40E